MPGVVAVVGATATGKSALALDLAEALGGEIVNADSRQVYRYMDIGTAKPSPEELSRVPHHLIDILDPDQPFNLALYLRQATQAVEDIRKRGEVPFLVGGSGLYVWGFLEGLRIPHVPPDPHFRAELELQAKLVGPQALHERLRKLDPDAADSINPNNLRRVIRALEVCEKSGVPFSKLATRDGLDYPFLVIGLSAPREVLYQRIDHRVDEMMERGLIDEVRGLMDRGYGLDLPSMSGVGYKQIGTYLQGQMALDEAVQKTKYETHKLARRQGTWFKADDQRIHWYDISGDFGDAVLEEVKQFTSVE
ncbi:MAG: tRNA (adenosine(37)-N6)-dimethylallyltransferase MiaA [Chloroflexi bacterium]|nr:tRNA (adenosine(37)-N6)-dimethylallyltransferase MiaA [Chloroflexota bacterium]